MRAKSTKTDAKVSQSELIGQYMASSEANMAKLDAEIASYKDSLELLQSFKFGKKSKDDGEYTAEIQELLDKCHNSRARISWYFNVIDTNTKNCAQLLDLKSLRKAKRFRIKAGKKRAKLLLTVAKLETSEKNIVQRIPSSVLDGTQTEKEKGNVGKKK